MTKDFVSQALKNFSTIGAVAPCSPAAAERMVESVDFENARTIVEFGGGTGPVTKEMLKRAHPEAKIYVFEVNEVFVEELGKLNDPRLSILHESAADAITVLQKLGVDSTDCVISTLPLAILKDDIVDAVFAAIKKILKNGGVYTQIQYSPILKARIEKEFGIVETQFTPLNIPPAFVYTVRK